MIKLNSNIGFCVISNCSNGNEKFFVFLERNLQTGEMNIDKKTYDELKYTLYEMGLVEIDSATFEGNAINNYTNPNAVKKSDIVVKKLMDIGLSYNRVLENLIISDMRRLFGNYAVNSVLAPYAVMEEQKKTIKKHKVPKVGETFTLYFYLFFNCHFIDNKKCIIELSGDFISKENSENRNFVQIVKYKFERIEDQNGVYIFQSIPGFVEMIEGIHITHSGIFKYHKVTELKGNAVNIDKKDYLYSILDIKRLINQDKKMVLEINKEFYFDYLMEQSKRIKREMVEENNKQMDVLAIHEEIVHIKNNFSDRMHNLANLDMFEQATDIKNAVKLLEEKEKICSKIKKPRISQKEFRKLFSIG